MASADSQGHGEDEIHLPDPSFWPLIAAFGAALIPVATLMAVYHPTDMLLFNQIPLWQVVGATGGVVTLFGALGWALAVVKDKTSIDIGWGNRTLSMAWLLFLVSEASIFGAFFFHYFYMIYAADGVWPPKGTPDIDLVLPAAGLMVLLVSSLTCELAHKALLRGRRGLAKTWLLTTIILGTLFVGLQAWEWGLLQTYKGITHESGYVGTIFYLVTGFHGVHVMTGLVLLLLVYMRLEMGSFDRQRHFSMNAASWYWHFVDVIWLFVFLFIYVGLQ